MPRTQAHTLTDKKTRKIPGGQIAAQLFRPYYIIKAPLCYLYITERKEPYLTYFQVRRSTSESCTSSAMFIHTSVPESCTSSAMFIHTSGSPQYQNSISSPHVEGVCSPRCCIQSNAPSSPCPAPVGWGYIACTRAGGRERGPDAVARVLGFRCVQIEIEMVQCCLVQGLQISYVDTSISIARYDTIRHDPIRCDSTYHD